jgi:hypothetical protein
VKKNDAELSNITSMPVEEINEMKLMSSLLRNPDEVVLRLLYLEEGRNRLVLTNLFLPLLVNIDH